MNVFNSLMLLLRCKTFQSKTATRGSILMLGTQIHQESCLSKLLETLLIWGQKWMKWQSCKPLKPRKHAWRPLWYLEWRGQEKDWEISPKNQGSSQKYLWTFTSTIVSPQVRFIFLDEICKDCGQRGDERLLDFCHQNILKQKQKYLKFLGKKMSAATVKRTGHGI